MQSWIYLVGAIVLEVAGTTSMKLSFGFTKLLPSILLFVFYGLSFVAFTFALKGIDVSIAYAVWAGIGTALIAAIGMTFFKEPVSVMKLCSIMVIIIGVAGLHLSGLEHQ
jgi:small multidrug resistance pump